MRKGLPVLLTMLLAVLVPATASAATSQAPPGNSGISQYAEVVPEAGGGTLAKRPTATKKGDSALSSEDRQQLQGAGNDGKQVEALVDSSRDVATPAAKPKAKKKPVVKKTTTTTTPAQTTETTSTAAASDDPESSGSAVAAAIGGSDGGGPGLGATLPILMGLALVSVVLAVVVRRKVTGTASGDGPEASEPTA